jgi:hypothetical protein
VNPTDPAAHWQLSMAPGIKAAAGQARARNAHRRTAVLARPGTARKLTQPPLSFTDPANWNGYIPPRLWHEQPNNAPQREALLEICAEAAPGSDD